MTQTCSICKNQFPTTGEYFYRDINIKSGFRRRCKDCMAASRSVMGEMVRNSRSRAKRKGLDFNLDKQFIVKLNDIQNGKCAISGIPLNWTVNNNVGKQRVCPPDRASLDRIDNTAGYTRNNVQLVVEFANKIKCWYPPGVIYDFCEAVLKNRPS